MPNVADYVIISDPQIILETGVSITHTFNFDLGTGVDHSQPAILQFYCRFTNTADRLGIQSLLNGTPVSTIGNVTGVHLGTIHEVVPSGLTQDNANRLDVKIVDGTGAVAVSDIVIFVKRAL